MPTRLGREVQAGHRRGRLRSLALVTALLSWLMVLGPAPLVSAETDGPDPEASATQESAPDPVVSDDDDRETLIAEALELGLITEIELFAPTSGSLVAAVPTVSSVRPATGPLEGDQIVVISGKDYGTVTKVEFDTTEATSIAAISGTQIVARVPDAAAAGAVIIKVTNADGTNTTGPTYTYVGPQVTGVSPLYAATDADTEVTITGKGFTGAVAADVKFGTNLATEIWVVSDTQIVAMSPIDDATPDPDIEVDEGVVDVTVTRNSVVSDTSANTKFLFTPGVPTVTGLLDSADAAVTGTGGVAVAGTLTITGTNLWGVNQVNFGAVKVTAADAITVNSAGTEIDVTVPSGRAGPVDITVQNVRGTSAVNLSTSFTYISTVAPKITTVTPSVLNKAASGGGGTFLVTGTGFSGMGTADVTINCASDVTPTAVVVVSDTSMIVTAPGNADTAAVCDLTVDNPEDGTKTITRTDAISYV